MLVAAILLGSGAAAFGSPPLGIASSAYFGPGPLSGTATCSPRFPGLLSPPIDLPRQFTPPGGFSAPGILSAPALTYPSLNGCVGQADLSTKQSATPPSATVGQVVTFEITVDNGGPDDAVHTTLFETVPTIGRLVHFRTSLGTCTKTRRGLRCDIGTLRPGATAVVVVDVTATAPGTATNKARVTADALDPNPRDNASEVTVVVTGAGHRAPP
jgi:uncharacterized repeat protein (TIGR01451 family)